MDKKKFLSLLEKLIMTALKTRDNLSIFLESIVPDKKDTFPSNGNPLTERAQGFNACREEVLRNIREHEHRLNRDDTEQMNLEDIPF